MANTLCVRMLRLAAQPRGIVCGSGLTSFATGAAAAVTPGKPAVRAKRRAGAAHHRGLRGPACQARNRLHSSSGSSQQQAAAVSTRQLAPASTSTSSGVHARMLHTAPSTCKSLAGPAIGDPLLILKQSPGQTVVVIAPSMAHDVMVDTRWDMAEHTHALKDHGITVYLADASHSEEDGSAQGKMWRWDYTKGRTAGLKSAGGATSFAMVVDAFGAGPALKDEQCYTVLLDKDGSVLFRREGLGFSVGEITTMVQRRRA